MHVYVAKNSNSPTIIGGAHLRDVRALPFGQLELAGLVEGPGLLHVLDELVQPRSTCRSTYNMNKPW